MNKNSNKTIAYVVISAVFSLLIISCGGGESSSGKDKANAKFAPGGKRPSKTIPVEVSKPDRGLAASYYVTTSTIEASSDAKINSRTSGVVTKILREEGDDVSSGDVLLVLDDDDQQLRLKQAQQKLASASREYNRLSKMRKAGVVSPTEWEAADNNFKVAETDKGLAELALSYTRVSAPFDGRVVWREVDLGAHVGQGELLFRMMSINPLLIRVHIPANRLGMVAVGQVVQLQIDSAAVPLKATVNLVSPIVDPTTGTVKITLKLDDYPENVRPGDFTEIQMVTDQHQNALLVSSVSLIEERGQHYLYVVEDGRAKRRPVVTGFIMSLQTEIVSGISENDLVVTKGQRNLNDEVKVEILSAKNKSKSDISDKKKSARKNSKKKREQG